MKSTQPAQRGPADDRALHAGRAEGHRTRQHHRRDEQRRQRLLSGHLEGAHRTKHQREPQQQAARIVRRMHRQQQHERHRALYREAGGDNAAPMMVVDDVAREQRQQQGGHELVEPDQAEIPGAVRDVIHVPADGDEQHLGRSGAEQPRTPHLHEGPLARQVGETGRSGGSCWSSGSGHRGEDSRRPSPRLSPR